jgi:hypothetical protein
MDSEDDEGEDLGEFAMVFATSTEASEPLGYLPAQPHFRHQETGEPLTSCWDDDDTDFLAGADTYSY